MKSDNQVDAFARILRRVGVFFTRLASEHTAAHKEMNKQELMTLDALDILGACSMGTIAQHLGLGQSTITPLIDRLEDQKIVHRIRSKEDRRVWLVELTDHGQSVSASREDAYRGIAADMMAPLSITERKTLIDLLNRITASVPDSNS
ncbi:MAG: MarR family transcriptional regulator [Bacteroidota bacterium]